MIRASRIRITSLLLCTAVTTLLSACFPNVPADVIIISKNVSVGTVAAAGGISHEHPPILDDEYGQEVFASPEQAINTLITAERNHNQDEVRTIFGLKREELFNSGDLKADYYNMNRMTDAYDANHWMQLVSNNERILFIGKDDEQFPIQLLKNKGWWRFDTFSGEEAILNRKIAHNELEVIRLSEEFIKAERAYAAERAYETTHIEYTRNFSKLHGDDRLKSLAHNSHHLYQGYYYKILTAQGEHARGGAKNYMEKGHLTKGFALLAWPQIYANTGIMTFIIDENGEFYEKDLGDNTKSIATHIITFDPDKSWKEP